MASRRIYSDPAVGQILSNIQSMMGTTPEEALQRAELAQRVAQIDKIRGETDSYNNVADIIGQFTTPEQIAKNAFGLYSANARGGGGLDLNKMLLGAAAAAEADNERLVSLSAGAGHATGLNDAYTQSRQDALRADTERMKDEETAAQLSNAFNINQVNEGGRNERFRTQPLQASPGETIYFNDEVFNGVPTPTTVKGGIMSRAVEGVPTTPEERAALALGAIGTDSGTRVPLDISPTDATDIDAAINQALGGAEAAASMDPQLRQQLLLRATEIYQTTRNSQGAVVQAVKEMVDTTETPTYWGFGSKKTFSEKNVDPNVADDIADPFSAVPVDGAPGATDPAVVDQLFNQMRGQPPAVPTPGPGEKLQRQLQPDGTYIYRVIKGVAEKK